MVARPTTHAVHNRECCLLRAQISGTRCAHSSTQVRFALGGTLYAENWHRASRDFLPFGFALYFGFSVQARCRGTRQWAVPVATLGSRRGSRYHGSRRSSLRVEIGVGVRAHAACTRATGARTDNRDVREPRKTPVKFSQNPIACG